MVLTSGNPKRIMRRRTTRSLKAPSVPPGQSEMARKACGCCAAVFVVFLLSIRAQAQTPNPNPSAVEPGQAPCRESTSGSAPQAESQSANGTAQETPIGAADITCAPKTADLSRGKQTSRMFGIVPNFAAVSANTRLPPLSVEVQVLAGDPVAASIIPRSPGQEFSPHRSSLSNT